MIAVAAAIRASEDATTPSVLAVPLDEFILGLVAFLIVFGFLAKVSLPSIRKTLSERTDSIEGGLQRAAEAEAEAKAALEQYRARLAGAHDEAATIRSKAESDGRVIINEARSEAESERAVIAQRAESQLSAERTQTVAALRRDVGGLAVDLAGRIVGESLQDDTRARAVVDRFITDLERSAARDQ